MTSKEKKIIMVLIVILAIAIIIFLINKNGKKENQDTKIEQSKEEYVEVLENGTKLNTSTKLSETKQAGVFKFENMQLTEQNGQTILLADVTNTSENSTKITLLDITFLDKDEKELATIGGIISPLKPGEKKQFNASATFDHSNAYDFKIVLK